MLLAIQILLGVLFAGTGVGLVVDVAKNRMDKIKDATGKQWASAFAVNFGRDQLPDGNVHTFLALVPVRPRPVLLNLLLLLLSWL